MCKNRQVRGCKQKMKNNPNPKLKGNNISDNMKYYKYVEMNKLYIFQ